MFSRKKVNVLSSDVLQSALIGDQHARHFIDALPVNIDPPPTEGIYRNDPAAWEVRVRAGGELRKFQREVLDNPESLLTPASHVEGWQTDFVSRFGEALYSQGQRAWRSDDLRLQVEQGLDPSAALVANLIKPDLGSSLGGIGVANRQERRIHKVADAMLLGALVQGYVEECGYQGSDRTLACGFGWPFCRWMAWSDDSGLVTTV